MHDIISFDAELGKTLQELHVLVCRKQYLESIGDSSTVVTDLRFRGAPIEDLCLDFTLPGYPEYVLKPGDENVRKLVFIFLILLCFIVIVKIIQTIIKFQVDINNLEAYISLVVDATVKTGIMRQMEAFRAGFNQVKFLLRSIISWLFKLFQVSIYLSN